MHIPIASIDERCTPCLRVVAAIERQQHHCGRLLLNVAYQLRPQSNALVSTFEASGRGMFNKMVVGARDGAMQQLEGHRSWLLKLNSHLPTVLSSFLFLAPALAHTHRPSPSHQMHPR